MEQPGLTAAQAAEATARRSYGRLVAVLASSTRHIPLAEDAVGDAFATALEQWPVTGVPDNPEGWIFAVARNRQRDRLMSAGTRLTGPLDHERDAQAIMDDTDPDAIPDKRLALMFVCAHPAIDPAARTPLMLQTVFGVPAGDIATTFAVPAPAMAQRLVRAKRRIRDARISFALPTRDQMPGRLVAVLEAVYGAYAIGWSDTIGATDTQSMAGEALHLATTLTELLPTEPEVLGLAALIALSLARADARTDSAGRFVPLDRQSTALWDATLIDAGERWLIRAAALHRPGRFQLEAAIQSAHCSRITGTETDWTAILRLHDALILQAPTLGARVSRASALAHVRGAAEGIAALDDIGDPAITQFQPAIATRAHLLSLAGRTAEAREAYRRAIALTRDAPTAQYLQSVVDSLPQRAD